MIMNHHHLTRGGILKLGGERVDVVLVDIICLHRGSPSAGLTAQDVAGGESLPGTGDQTLVSQLLELLQVTLRHHFLELSTFLIKIFLILFALLSLLCSGRIYIRDLTVVIIICILTSELLAVL